MLLCWYVGRTGGQAAAADRCAVAAYRFFFLLSLLLIRFPLCVCVSLFKCACFYVHCSALVVGFGSASAGERRRQSLRFCCVACAPLCRSSFVCSWLNSFIRCCFVMFLCAVNEFLALPALATVVRVLGQSAAHSPRPRHSL